MSNYKHILFAADLDEKDDTCVGTKAASLAKQCGAKLSIVHVVERFYAYDLTLQVSLWEDEIRQHVRERMQALGEEYHIPQERQFIESGKIKTSILDLAAREHVDLIVVGSHTRHGLGLLFLGSTAFEILNASHCDILSVWLKDEDES
ncbi:MAG: universal stress protein [Chlamydiia bacterium]|nr:universal stress protein [Chlamydiia bacterium]